MAEHLLRIARKFGPYRFGSTCRSEREQEKLYANRATNPFPVAAPGHSAHQRGLAVDMDRPDVNPFQDLFLHVLGASWREAGPGMVWDESDPIHFEWRPN